MPVEAMAESLSTDNSPDEKGDSEISEQPSGDLEQQIEENSEVVDPSPTPVKLTYQQRKLLEYERESLLSFGGSLSDIVVKPKLSKIELEKKALQNSTESHNIVINRKRRLIEDHCASFGGSLDSVFQKVSPKSKFDTNIF